MPFHHGIVNPILDIIGQIPRGYSNSNSNVPLGSSELNDQMLAIVLSIGAGLPGVGLGITAFNYGTDQDTNTFQSIATMGITSAILYRFMPGAAGQALEFSMYRLLLGAGFHPERAWAPPMWLFLALSYGYWHSITKEPGAKGTVGMTFGAVPPSQHQGGPVWKHLERTHG